MCTFFDLLQNMEPPSRTSLLGYPVLPERKAKVATIVSSIEKREKAKDEQKERRKDERGENGKEGANKTEYTHIKRVDQAARMPRLNCICKSTDGDQFVMYVVVFINYILTIAF